MTPTHSRGAGSVLAFGIFACCITGATLVTHAAEAHAAQTAEPIQFEAALVADRLQNVHGGLQAGGRSMLDAVLAASLDLAQALDFSGFVLSGSVRYDSAGHMSQRYVGDLQGVSNIDAPQAWRLYELWLDWQSTDTALGAGIYDLNSEFDVSETAALFLNGSHGIGAEIGLSGPNGPSIFPVTGVGFRFSRSFSGAWTVKLAALDAVPGHPDHQSRFVDVRLSADEGALIFGEISKSFSGGSARAGLWQYTQKQPRLDARGSDKSRGFYFGVDHELGDQWRGFLRGGVASPSVNPVSGYAAAGLVRSTAFSALPRMDIGLAVNRAWITQGFRDSSGPNAPTQETNIEITVRIALTPMLALQPDLQWVIDPAEAQGRDALVVGLRIVGMLTF